MKNRFRRFQDSPYPALITAGLVYLIVIFPQFRESIFIYDNFYNLWRAQRAAKDLVSIFEPTFAMRFSPLYLLLLSLLQGFFGLNPFLYGVVNGVLHLANSFLLFRLVRRLRGPSSPGAALFGSIFFLFSSTQWGVLWDIGQTTRLICAFFSLSSLLFFARFRDTGKGRDFAASLALFILSFACSEDFVALPLLLVAMAFLVPSLRIPRRREFFPLLPFFAVSFAAIFLAFHFKAPQGWKLGFQFHVPLNFFYLMKDFIQFLLIPRPEFIPLGGLPGTLLRLAPLLLAGLFLAKACSFRSLLFDPSFIFGIAWMGITAGLYALRPMDGTWQGRYLYLPAMGGAIGIGVMILRVGSSLNSKFLRGVFLAFIFYSLGLNGATTLLMVRRARAEFKAATPEEIPVIFSLVGEIRNQYGGAPEIPPDTILAVEGLPFSLARLKELLWIYYASLPREIIEAKPDHPLRVLSRQENQRLLYLKWQNHRLSVQKG